MKHVVAIAAFLLGAGFAEAGTPSPGDASDSEWRPALGTPVAIPDRPATGTRRAAEPVWITRIEHRDVIDRPDLIARVKRNEDTARPGFATLQRSFGTGDFRPYVGMGIGAASTQFDGVTDTADDAFAVKAVVGGNLRFSDKVGGYVQYERAMASEGEAARRARKAHGLRFGLSIALN